MNMKITKRELVKAYGSQIAVARLFGIYPSAIHAWGWDDPIPQMREMQLRYEIDPARWNARKRSA